jgi:hypothetical protein
MSNPDIWGWGAEVSVLIDDTTHRRHRSSAALRSRA